MATIFKRPKISSVTQKSLEYSLSDPNSEPAFTYSDPNSEPAFTYTPSEHESNKSLRDTKMIQRWEEGYPLVDLVNEFNCSDSTIQNILNKNGYQVKRSFQRDNTIKKYNHNVEEREVESRKEILLLKLKSYLALWNNEITLNYSPKGFHKLTVPILNDKARTLFLEVCDLGRLVGDNFIIEDSSLIQELLKD